MDDNDDTTRHCVCGTHCDDALLKDGDVGLILPSSHEQVEDHVQLADLWT